MGFRPKLGQVGCKREDAACVVDPPLQLCVGADAVFRASTMLSAQLKRRPRALAGDFHRAMASDQQQNGRGRGNMMQSARRRKRRWLGCDRMAWPPGQLHDQNRCVCPAMRSVGSRSMARRDANKAVGSQSNSFEILPLLCVCFCLIRRGRPNSKRWLARPGSSVCVVLGAWILGLFWSRCCCCCC